MNYQLALTESEKRLRDIELALNESSIVVITDNKGTIQFANDKFCKISKYSQKEIIGSKHNIINSGHHDLNFFKEMWRTISNGIVWRGEIKNKAKDGSYYWVHTTIVPYLAGKGEPYQYIAIRHDITKRKQYEEQIELMAYYDSLTSLPNRNLLNKWVMERPLKKEDIISVLFLDLDRFKSINDNFGHDTGDLVLKEVARRLRNCLRKSDFISRQGGDEFIIILDDMYSKQDSISVATKISNQLALPYRINNNNVITSTSIGISMGTIRDDSCICSDFIETLIKHADNAMYHAKKQGGNTHCFNTPYQNHQLERYYQIEQEIKKALGQEQLSIVYQPLINLNSTEVIGVEALLRWNNPRLGKVSPLEFIPLLEEFGLIIPVSKWILKTVCNQLRIWRNNGVLLEKIAINISPIQFRDHMFAEDLKQILEEAQIEPSFLELEITEGTLLNITESTRTLKELKNLGVRISIDDFGTGYSSLSYLKQLPIDSLKIDKSFIDELDVDGKIIVNTIVNMGRNLNFTIIAEGIEKKEQLQYLKGLDCHEGQGYYWSKPLPSEDIAGIYHNSVIYRPKILKIE
ncbi:putative bifunctional diguanylate cyclase/phosphodiesterase [Aquibacillus saliphilus]|uniref:putative bifunctional diguanylate cyclase/phosphodiesterase n=1 Tax=Aquibacillus saliphilus TaxID=1909422 RepID=UPI001CEFD9B2|nr:EAL domain-containing protein [Aquibacillus saliphilus]